QGVIGLDLGRTDVAVTSEGESFSGKQITQVRDQYSRARASLQKKATGDADFNGANVIKLLGLSVNQPRGSYLSCELRRKVETRHGASLLPT
ncbi:MAG: hypothetical protein RIU46_33105, partial [Deltaproteobacteria bacterium]